METPRWDAGSCSPQIFRKADFELMTSSYWRHGYIIGDFNFAYKLVFLKLSHKMFKSKRLGYAKTSYEVI